ncbi:MAG: hypothetical protein R2755_29500 [Acidimicrobiales bacterium]
MTRTTFQVAYLLTVDGDVRATGVTVHGAMNMAGQADPAAGLGGHPAHL